MTVQEKEIPQIIKVQPWTGLENEIYEGKKTKVFLYSDRLEYMFNFTQRVYISFVKEDEEPGEKIEKRSFCKETGVVDKQSIYSFEKYISTEYAPVTGDEVNVHMVDIRFGGSGTLSMSQTTEEEQTELFNAIYSWKYTK